MPSRLILLDEWLFSHLQGEEGSERPATGLSDP
jgi:hypothetical protein